MLQSSIPEEAIEDDGEGSRGQHRTTPPGLAEEDPCASTDEAYRSKDAGYVCQQPGCTLSDQARENPRTIGPDHPRLQLEEPCALSQVQQMDETVQYAVQ